MSLTVVLKYQGAAVIKAPVTFLALGQLQNKVKRVDLCLQLPLALVVPVNAPDSCKDLS